MYTVNVTLLLKWLLLVTWEKYLQFLLMTPFHKKFILNKLPQTGKVYLNCNNSTFQQTKCLDSQIQHAEIFANTVHK